MSIIFVARYQAPSDQARAQYNNYNYQPQQQQQPPRQARALYNAGNEGGKELLTEFCKPIFLFLKIRCTGLFKFKLVSDTTNLIMLFSC